MKIEWSCSNAAPVGARPPAPGLLAFIEGFRLAEPRIGSDLDVVGVQTRVRADVPAPMWPAGEDQRGVR